MTTILQETTRRPDISFFRSGKIDITSRVARLLAITPGDVLDIAVEDGEYYLFVRVRSGRAMGRHQAVCIPTKHGARNFRAYSVGLSAAMLRAAAVSGKEPAEARFACGQAVTHPAFGVMVPIITHKAL
jgi:hypothetical protein